jgi:very-short-patch-repair endonuclease
MKRYKDLTEIEKKQILTKEYEINKKSFQDIAVVLGTYANKLRRDAIKYEIKIRDKTEAQKNALAKGRTKHPTKGKTRSEEVKSRIGNGVMKSWENLDQATLDKRKEKARVNWEKLGDNEKANILREANIAVRESSKKGSKLEKYLLNKLISDGYKVDFHKEQSLLNTKLQIDLFLPTLNIAIEVDGLSHFEPVWGSDALKRNQGYDNKKTGLILGKGLVLIRVVQKKDFSKARADVIYNELSSSIKKITNKFPDKDGRNIIIGDK